MTRKETLDQMDLANETFCNLVKAELKEGYRGYQLAFYHLYRHADGEIHAAIHMFMDHSPLHPRNGMFVDGELELDAPPQQLDIDFQNLVDSIKMYIDKAYGEPYTKHYSFYDEQGNECH